MTKPQPFCCDITSGTKEEQNEFKRLHTLLVGKFGGYSLPTYRFYGININGMLDCFASNKTSLNMFTRILPLSEGILILKKMVGEEEKPTEKTLTISDVMALLPSSEIIESNGIEGGLRDGELQMFWEGAEWLKKYIENKLTPKP